VIRSLRKKTNLESYREA